jgi:kynurenine formamidase
MKVAKPSVALATLLLSACSSIGPAPWQSTEAEWIDLSHTYDKSTLYWPNNTRGFEHVEEAHGTTPAGFFYSSYSLSTPEHGGTHIDAPIHFAANGLTVDRLPLSSLTGQAVVVDVSAKASANRDYRLSVDDLLAWETAHGRIDPATIVLVRTGYGRHYPDRAHYFGTTRTGAEAIPELHFPGVHPEATRWLVEQRDIKALGIDTASIDYGQSTDFLTHQILMAKNKPGFENLANLDQLPARGVFVVALPMKIGGGSGGPLRIIATRAR